MPGRHGRSDDETTQQAYYGQDEGKTEQADYGQDEGKTEQADYGRRSAPGPQQGGYGPGQPPRGQQRPGGASGGGPQQQYEQQQYGQQQYAQPPYAQPQQQFGPPPQQFGSPRPPQVPYGQGGYPPAPKKRKKWPFVVGAVVVLLIVIAVASGGGRQPTTPAAGPGQPGSAASPAPGGGPSSAPGSESIVYEVTGSGRATNITYSSNGSGGISQQNNAQLPYTKTIPATETFGFWSLVAQNGEDSGQITCRITRNGEVINESSSEGPYAVVTCQGS